MLVFYANANKTQIILPIIHFSFYFGKFEVQFTGIFHYSFVLPLSYHRDCLCK